MSRAIFETVDDDAPGPSGATVSGGDGGSGASRARARRRVSIWLFALAGLVVAQIVVGGLTRLTDSGLSITDWRPVTGVIPPLTEAQWLAELEEYRQTAEYQEQNQGMTLDEFKVIFWWEWGHRSWGRLIGLVFIGGFAWFSLTKTMPIGWSRRILAIGLLGALQGLVGWWMVASGVFGDRLDVSPVRLAIHLILAFVILGLLLWAALSLLREEWDLLQSRRRRERRPLTAARVFVGLLTLQIFTGAVVAGLDAGFAWRPMLANFGVLPPDDPFSHQESALWIHFALGMIVALATIAFVLVMRRSAYSRTRRWGAIVLAAVVVQVLLGVAAAEMGLPIWMAALHQFWGVATFATAVHAWHQTALPKEERLAA